MNIHQFAACDPKFASLASVGKPDRIIEGRHCAVACNQLSKQSGCTTWHFSPGWIAVGRTFSSDTDEEWIANSISYLPDIDYFINFTSLDQVHNWVLYRDCAADLALCFWAEEPTFLKNELKEGKIDRFSYQYKLIEAKIYKSLWEVIKGGETDIQEIIRNKWGFPFDSSRAFFVEIVREVLEGEFCICLKRRHIYNASHIKQIAILKRKVHQEIASTKEVKKLNTLIDQNVPFATWLNRLLNVAELLSKTNSPVRESLENYQQGIYDLAKLHIHRDCNSKLRHHRVPTHSWIAGKYQRGVIPAWPT